MIPAPPKKDRVFSPEVSSLIGHILSEPEAKRLEFGAGRNSGFPGPNRGEGGDVE